MQLKFLITGCHGDLAFSIAKIIKKNFKNSKVFGTDVVKDGIGKAIFDKCFLVPKVKNPKYIKKILKISKSVNLIIPSTEKEIIFLSKNLKKFKNKILINEKKIINLFSNKISTQKFLKENFKNFSLKFNMTLKDYYLSKKLYLPFFLKKKIGSGNQNYRIIKNKSELLTIKNYNIDDWVVEEFLNMNSNEYTSVIIKINQIKKVLIFKRILHKLGHTMYAKPFRNAKIEKNLLDIADKIDLNGSINIQFKIKKNKIKIFDINPRLSSTVRMRDIIGFQDCVWWISDKLNIKINKFKRVNRNKTIVKFFEEKIIT